LAERSSLLQFRVNNGGSVYYPKVLRYIIGYYHDISINTSGIAVVNGIPFNFYLHNFNLRLNMSMSYPTGAASWVDIINLYNAAASRQITGYTLYVGGDGENQSDITALSVGGNYYLTASLQFESNPSNSGTFYLGTNQNPVTPFTDTVTPIYNY
jgi:hypothetical protein